eukprot:GILI01037492.1.p1 GENE.GILI01037492.1~~GILI01037492.1.p1  ORF type:complete len:391 (+),score=48.00 GILI01037492.1:80-1174(+)
MFASSSSASSKSVKKKSRQLTMDQLSKLQQSSLMQSSGLDPSVLSSLPVSIRLEVLSDLEKSNKYPRSVPSSPHRDSSALSSPASSVYGDGNSRHASSPFASASSSSLPASSSSSSFVSSASSRPPKPPVASLKFVDFDSDNSRTLDSSHFSKHFQRQISSSSSASSITSTSASAIHSTSSSSSSDSFDLSVSHSTAVQSEPPSSKGHLVRMSASIFAEESTGAVSSSITKLLSQFPVPSAPLIKLIFLFFSHSVHTRPSEEFFLLLKTFRRASSACACTSSSENVASKVVGAKVCPSAGCSCSTPLVLSRFDQFPSSESSPIAENFTCWKRVFNAVLLYVQDIYLSRYSAKLGGLPAFIMSSC